MNGITIFKNVKVELSAKQWQLYEDKSGSDYVAMVLNRNLENALNVALLPDTRLTPDEVRQSVHQQMEMFSEFGACDTESRRVLENVLELAFNSK